MKGMTYCQDRGFSINYMEEKYIKIEESKTYLLSNYGNIKDKYTVEFKGYIFTKKDNYDKE